MKRKLEESDDGFFEKPSKILPTAAGNFYYQDDGSPPGHYGHPVQTSTPLGATVDGGGQRSLTAMPGNPARNFQSNVAADNELRHVINNFVSVYEQLDKGDDPDVKPNYSYSELAYIAMLRSPNFCLPIGQIYSYIQNRFKFFRNSTRKHWKNAVRHSLAKTMCFSKIPVGRGASKEKLARSTYLWCILPSSIACFARGDYRATIDRETGTNTLRSAYFRMNSEPFWNAVGDYIANKMAHFRRILEESTTPGHIFETQTCSLPWKQENNQSVTQPLIQREVFQEVQNQPRIPVNIQLRNSGLTRPASPQVYYIAQSPEMVLQPTQTHISSQRSLPPAQSQSSSHIQMYHAQTRSSSPILNAYEDQSRNQSTFNQRNKSAIVEDPWLSGIAISSPESSLIGSESERRTPFYTSFDCTDSGYVDSYTNNSSCNFPSSCQKQNQERYLTSPPVNDVVHCSNSLNDNDEYDFNQFDLSPFSLSDFSDSNEINGQRKCTPEKIHGSQMISPSAQFVGNPRFISTPVDTHKIFQQTLIDQTLPPIQCRQALIGQPTVTPHTQCRQAFIDQPSPPSQCRFMYQPPLLTQNNQGRSSPTSPVMFNGDMFSTPIIPHWSSYC